MGQHSMKEELSYSQHLKNARIHLRRFSHRTRRAPASSMEVTDNAVQDLTSAWKELQIANEGLLRQSGRFASALQRLEDSFQDAPDAHVVTDQFGVIRKANQAASVLLQLPIARVEGKPLVIFLGPDSQPVFQAQLSHLDAQSRYQEFQYMVQPRDGPIFSGAFTVSTGKDAETGENRLHWQFRDVSARWHAEKRMRDLARLALLNQEQDRARVSSALSNGISQVLVALSMQLSAASETLTLEQSPLRNSLEAIRAQLQDAVAGIETLAEGLYPPQLGLLGLNATLRDYCDSFARERGLVVAYQGSSVQGLTEWNRILLFRALRVVLDHAEQQRHPSRLNVSLDAEGHTLRLEVKEQAIGFDGHLRDSSAFRTEGDSRSERKDNGGITEMSDRLELLGGTMEIRTQPGSGSRVVVSLPFD